jgi:hypothetical protein
MINAIYSRDQGDFMVLETTRYAGNQRGASLQKNNYVGERGSDSE